MCNGDGTAEAVGDGHVWVDAEKMIDRGDDVAGGYGVTGRIRGVVVCGDKDRSAFDAVAG